jgi:hypothetical protein
MKIQPLMAVLMTGTMCQFSTGSNRLQAAEAAPANTRQVIQQKLRDEVAARLAEAGAAADEIEVTVAVKRDSATPFKITYRGLRNFKGADGTTPEADGEFVMNYIGGGQWQGALAGTKLTASVGTRDNVDLPFVNDPSVLGEWQSMDFVGDISAFNPAQPTWKGNLYLKGLTFLEGGKMPQAWWTWTRGVLIHHGDKTASRYEIKEIGGVSYLFLEWKSGDVTIAGMKPCYYVLRQKASSEAQ